MSEPERWPTLGPQVAEYMEDACVFGPGAVEGEPYRLRLSQRAFVYAAYEVYPQGHPRAGRRRYSEAFDTEPKGCAKTELGSGVAVAELDGPVRCDGFDAAGNPVGRPVIAPNIPFLAVSQEQAADLAYTRFCYMLEHGALADRVAIGQMKTYLPDRNGVAYPVTARAASSDGGIPTHGNGDESHLWISKELKALYAVTKRNLKKGPANDPWFLHQTTAWAHGERSVAEETHDLAEMIARGEVSDPGLLFVRRHAGDHHDLKTEDGVRAAIAEAYGDALHLADVEKILQDFRDPRVRDADRRRYWLNQVVKGAHAWLSPDVIRAGARPALRLGRRDIVALGFDGSLYHDATALIACRLSDGALFVIGFWAKPANAGHDWEVDKADVDRVFRRAMRELDVARVNADKHWWQDYISAWHADFGDRIVEWDTRRETAMAAACERLETAFLDGSQTFNGLVDGIDVLTEHFENARTKPIGAMHLREEARPPVVIRKESKHSTLCIDGAVASVLAKEAAAEAIERGALARKRGGRVRTY